MNANELRLGNLMHYYGNDVTVMSISKESADFGYFTDSIGFTRHYDVDFPKPIPLTEEWLEKFNFSRLDNEYWFNRDYPSYDLNLTGSFRRHYMDFDNDDSESFEIEDKNINIKYVHQLQNLYFALTGEELTIKI